MSDSDVRKRTSRLHLEFSLVFASVILALLADEWRSDCADAAAERRALALVVRDLDADAEDLRFFRAALIAQQDAAIRFISKAQDGTQEDSLPSDAEDALRALYYRPNHPTYQGLVREGLKARLVRPLVCEGCGCGSRIPGR